MFIGFVTTFCCYLLLQARTAVHAGSYSELGYKLYGKTGEALVDLTLILSQSGFCCAYVYFIKTNLATIFEEAFHWNVEPNNIAIGLFFMFTLLCYVRKLQIFASTHVFADLIVVVTIVIIIIFASMNISRRGSMTMTVPFLNSYSFTDAIGFSVYCYEGIGVVLPIQDVCRDQAKFPAVLLAVMISVASMYIAFGMICVAGWGI